MIAMLASIFVRIRALVNRRTADADIDDELRYHLERETERNVANGMSPSDARHAARRAFGNPTVHADLARDAIRWPWLDELMQDVSYAMRTFRRAPTFVVGVVATIGLGLGLLTTAFTLFDAYVLRPLTIRDPGSLYESNWSLTWTNYQSFSRDGGGVFSDVIGTRQLYTRVRGQPMIGEMVTGNYFDVLGVTPAIGRMIARDDASVPGAGRSMVLNYDTWRSVFGGDTAIVGKTVLVDHTLMTVVGVARPSFSGLGGSPEQFWAPITLEPLTDSTPIKITGHVRPGLSPQQAVSRLRAWMVASTPRSLLPRIAGPSGTVRLASFEGLKLVPRGTSVPLERDAIMVFAPVAVAFLLVMLTACANVANMMLARGMARQREIGIRLALGAGRGRVVRQLITEALVLSFPCAAIAFVVSRVTVRSGAYALLATMPEPFVARFHMRPLEPDGRVLAFMLVAAAASAVGFGLMPAIQSTRASVVRASRGDFDTPFRKSTLRGLLLFGQIAVSVLLLVCAGVLLRAAMVHGRVDVGFRTRNIVQMSMRDSVSTPVLERIRAEHTVGAIASASSPPLDGGLDQLLVKTNDSTTLAFDVNVVSPEYFSLLELPIVRGRGFSEDEGRSSASVAIVTQAAAARLWPGLDPIGKEVVMAPADRQRKRLEPYHHATVIGVARNATPGWIGRSAEWPVVYYPQPVDAKKSVLLVRVTNDAIVARSTLDRAVSAVDSGAIDDVHTLEQAMDVQIYPYRMSYAIAWFVGGVALLLTIAGVYGVLSYLVAQRTREMGVRMALGASGNSLIGLILGSATRLAVLGTAVGSIAALGVSKLFAHSMMWIDVYDPIGYAIGVVVVLAATIAAAYVPARRAATVNPVDALRADS
jgi:predicted permease